MMSDMHIHIREGYKDYEILKLYIEQAKNMNFEQVVFLEHSNRVNAKHSAILSSKENIDIYINTIKQYKNNDLKILTGIEIDYSNDLDFRNKTIELLEYGNFDWVIGSIHSIKFDDPKDYYLSIIDLINNYPINCIGHIKLNEEYVKYKDIFIDILKLSNLKDIKIEINTSDRSRWNDEQLIFMLMLMKKYNVNYVIGSDSHKVEEVGYLIKEINNKIKKWSK